MIPRIQCQQIDYVNVWIAYVVSNALNIGNSFRVFFRIFVMVSKSMFHQFNSSISFCTHACQMGRLKLTQFVRAIFGLFEISMSSIFILKLLTSWNVELANWNVSLEYQGFCGAIMLEIHSLINKYILGEPKVYFL